DSIDRDLKASLEAAREATFDKPESIISRVKSQMDWVRIGEAYRRIYNPETPNGVSGLPSRLKV
ncbi:MAG: hypothetical protein JSW26_00820, partial [Desulfobacterales bacterium]